MRESPADMKRALYAPLIGNTFVAAYPPFEFWSSSIGESLRQFLSLPPSEALPLGLYVHLPFCVQRCSYCCYMSRSDRMDVVDAYLDRLAAELTAYRRSPALSSRPLDFVYFGGGTPSLLSTSRLERLFGRLQSCFPWDRVREVTFECAPRSVTAEKARLLGALGVTRLSLGVQQLDDTILRINGRVHLSADVYRAYEHLRASGVPTLNVDLIAGLAGETTSTFFTSLDRVLRMAPESITIYALEVPPNTPLARALRGGTAEAAVPPRPVRYRRLEEASVRLQDAGYRRQSAYSFVRDPARHPFLYMREQYRGADVLGIGASSFSYLRGLHFQNVARFDEYLAGSPEALAVRRGVALSMEERLVREFILGLKLGEVNADRFRRRFGTDVLTRFADPLAELVERRWIRIAGRRAKLTRAGCARVDGFLRWFYLPPHREDAAASSAAR